MTIRVMGAGAFGTALAISLAEKPGTTLWARDGGHAREMATLRENRRRLPGPALPEALAVTSGDANIADDDTVLLAIPMQKLRPFLHEHRDLLDGKALVACCKGMEIDSGLGPVSLISQCLPSANPALLTGPSFAQDIARGLPTALTLACASRDLGARLQSALSAANLRIYRTEDVIGAELGGALKNVIAIACGIAIGAGFGDSARAALMTRGFAEMRRLATALGAREATLAGLSGFGDLALTCTSEQSRNFRLGLAIGRQEAFDPSVTVEGAATAEAAASLSAKLDIEMPVTSGVNDLVRGNLTPERAMAQLLARPLKEE